MKGNLPNQPFKSQNSIVSIGPENTRIMLESVCEWLKKDTFDEYILVLPKFGPTEFHDFLSNYNNVTIYNEYHPIIIRKILNQQRKDKSKKIMISIVGSCFDSYLTEVLSSCRTLNIYIWVISQSSLIKINCIT